MTSTGRQLRNRGALPRIRAVHPSASGPPLRASGRRLEDCVSRAWVAAGAASWLLLLGIAVSIEPRPSDPTAIPTLLDAIFTSVFLVALSAAAFGFSVRRRAGFAASLAGAGVLLVGVLLCPATGHHAMGAWWYVQLACVGGLMAVSVLGLLRAPTVGD